MAFLPSALWRSALFASRSFAGLPLTPSSAGQPLPFHKAALSPRAQGKLPAAQWARSYATPPNFASSSTKARDATTSATRSRPSREDGVAADEPASTASHSSIFSPNFDELIPKMPKSRVLTPDAFEAAFRERPRKGWAAPNNSTSGRTTNVVNGEVQGAFRMLSAALNRNQIRRELRLKDRYEKPNRERRRKESERHRRRFADMVRKKIQLVSCARFCQVT